MDEWTLNRGWVFFILTFFYCYYYYYEHGIAIGVVVWNYGMFKNCLISRSTAF